MPTFDQRQVITERFYKAQSKKFGEMGVCYISDEQELAISQISEKIEWHLFYQQPGRNIIHYVITGSALVGICTTKLFQVVIKLQRNDTGHDELYKVCL